MRQLISVLGIVALVLSACRAGTGPPQATGPLTSASTATVAGLTHCEDIAEVSAPPERYGDEPIYVANEMPVEEVRAWSATKPGFEEIWIDRDHLGWITLAFSVDADARQAELEEVFPGVGVVAVGVDWTMAELEELQRRIGEELSPIFDLSSGISVQKGVVSIGVGVLTEERLAAIEERFGDDPICIEGTDPAAAPPDGPQARAGDGWRLLADERAGQPYRTGIAFDAASYERLWREIGLTGDQPDVDFETEVVIWFGAVYGSSCPDLRLDDVVVDRARALVHAEIVLIGAPMACTLDANPRAYSVAVERTRLPEGPFAIQLGAQDPPSGVPEERTLVDVDLSQPGAVARPGEIHGDPGLSEPQFVESGDVIEPGFPTEYRLSVHCGVEWLGMLNDIWWRTDVPDNTLDHVPPEWAPVVDEKQTIVLSVLMETDPAPMITATANGHAVTYRPTTDDPPGCD
jgi:hypothetical protein